MSDERVLVAGGGPVGLFSALTLARAGVPVTVLEAESTVVRSPRAAGYQWPAAQIFESAGILEDAIAVGVIKRASQFRRPATGAVDMMSLGIFDNEEEQRFDLHLGQDSLSDIILRHLNELDEASVRWNSRVTDVTQDAAGVTVAIETNGRSQEVSGEWLIGADGPHSAVRRALGLGFDGHTWDTRFVATNVYFDFEAHGFGRATFVRDPTNWAIIIKIAPDGLWRLAYGEDPELPEEEVRARLAERYREILPGRDHYEVARVAAYRVHERCAERFRVGRVLLAGDAAHICNPAGGFGLAGGLFDANALTRALLSHLAGQQAEDVLDLYAEERRSIFLNFTSPQASEFKRILAESDPDKMREDDQRVRMICTDPKVMPIAASIHERLVGSFPLK